MKPREGRHIEMDLNKIDLGHDILKLLKGNVDQVTLDWIWLHGSHTRECLTKAFYRESIPRLVELLRPGGTIYLPLCPSTFVRIVEVEPMLAATLSLCLLTSPLK
jgi:hypothetical protein